MILLDTNALLWMLYAPERIGPQARDRLDSSDRIHVSAISHVEMHIKQIKGKLRFPASLPIDLRRMGLEPLPLRESHAAGLAEFPELDGHDPFDRQIVAQAWVDRLTLVTADDRLLKLGRDWIIDSRR